MIMVAVLLAGEPTAFPQVFSPPASSALSLVHWLTNSAASARRSCTLCPYPNSTTANPYNRVSQGTACCTPCPASPSTAETFACLSSAAYAGCGGGCVARPLTHPPCASACSGVATSLLYSVFEAWMTKEHNARSFHPSLLDSTFSRAALISAVVASTSGQLADAVHEAFDVPLCVGSAGTTTPAPCNNTTHMVP